MISIVGSIKMTYNKTCINMSFSNTQLTKNMTSQLFYGYYEFAKNNKICHFQIRN